MKTKRNNSLSLETQDLFERVPDSMNTAFVVAVLVFFIGLVFAGIFIKSPDMIRAEVRITGITPPQVIKANSAGKLIMLQDSLPKKCKAGTYIACIENSSDVKDVERLKSILYSCTPTEIDEDVFSGFQKSTLGELYHSYYSLESAIVTYHDLLNRDNQYSLKLHSLRSQMTKDSISLNDYRNRLERDSVLLGIRQKDYLIDSVLHSKNAALESQLDKSRIELLNTQKEVLMENNNVERYIQDMHECRKEIYGTEYQYSLAIKKALNTLYHSYNELITEILEWEDRYIFKTDVDGTVELANLVHENSFISVEEPVFTLVADNSNYYGIALLPPSGAGQVARGQKVNIKVAAYPYEEYGVLRGEVSDISMNTTTDGGYLVYINLPEGMTSTNGVVFTFAKAMVGEADIITKEKRLVERIFSQIYKVLSNE